MTLEAQAIVPEPFPTVAAALWQPERRLMLAVLEDAIDTYLANVGALHGIRRLRFREASAWFRSDDAEWPFSFVRICDALGLDTAVVRRMLVRRLKQEVLGPPARPSRLIRAGGGLLEPACRPGSPAAAALPRW